MTLKYGKVLCILLGAAFTLGACATTVLPHQPDIRVANLDPVSLGTLDIGIVRLFSNTVELMQVPVVYNPRTDAVTLEFRVQLTRFRQFWTRRMREAFIRALAAYEADYEARDLPRGSATRMGRTYATMKGRTEWWLFSITTEYEGFPLVDLGYNFKDGSPYFTVTQRKTEDVRERRTNQVSSLHIVLYFNRAMARDLAALFDEDYLHGLIPERYLRGSPVEEDFSGPPPGEETGRRARPPVPADDFDAPGGAAAPRAGVEE
jgi:hypothetical protein